MIGILGVLIFVAANVAFNLNTAGSIKLVGKHQQQLGEPVREEQRKRLGVMTYYHLSLERLFLGFHHCYILKR